MGANAIAEQFGLEGTVVGFSLAAVGTSLPELVTAIAAARQKETALLLGNLLGSNMFNSLAVGGTIAVVGPGAIDSESTAVGIGSMVLVAVLVWIFMVTRRQIGKIEAGILFLVWIVSVIVISREGTVEEAAQWLIQ